MLAVLLLAPAGMAQRKLTLSVPECPTFFKVETEGLNMRKRPDAGSAKLMVWYSDAGSYETYTRYFFSDENRGRYKADDITGAFTETVHPKRGDLLPVTEDCGEWLRVEMLDNEVCVNAYVMKKFGTIINVTDMGQDTFCPSKSTFDIDGNLLPTTNAGTIHRPSGMYKDLKFNLTIDQNSSSDTPFYATLRFPFILGGKYLAVETANIQVIPTTGQRRPEVFWDKEYGMDDEVFYTTNLKISASRGDGMYQNVAESLLGMPEVEFGRMLDSLLFNTSGNPLEIWIRSQHSSYEELPVNMQYSSYPKHSQTFTFAATEDITSTTEGDDIYTEVEQAPSFPGGNDALARYLRNNLKYPTIAVENKIKGKVIVGFVVERDGSVSKVRIVRGVDPSLDKEAARVVRAMPKWSPGIQKGRTVRVKYTLPITFNL